MRACSPPLALKMVLSLGFFLLIRGISHGQDFILPDLVVIRDARPDIALPNQFPNLAATWEPAPPRYRRQYRIPLENYLEAPKSLPKDLLPDDPMLDIDGLELPKITASMDFEPLQPGVWSASITADMREGVDLGVGHMLGSIGEIGAVVFVPFPEANLRPWSGGVEWTKDGLLSGAAKVGMKEGREILPYLAANLSWDRGINQPDKYFVELHSFGYSAYRLSILSAIDLSFRFRENSWSIITKIEGGVSRTKNDTEGSARGVFAIRLNSHELHNELGVDIAYDDSNGILAMPFLGFNWLPDDNISVYANAEIFMRYPDNLGSVFFKERVDAFEAQIPIQSRYRIGIAQIEKKRLSYLIEVSYAEGSFCSMEDRVIVSRDDRRILGLVAIGYDFGRQRISFSGKLNYSLPRFTDTWESRIELAGKRLSYYVFSGSQDAILAEFSGDFRGEGAIIGLGLNWKIDESWRASMSAYAGVMWDRPSLKLALAWKSAGAADE